MSDLTPSRDEPRADREPVAPRHLDELEEITREYARLTEREPGAWTLLVAGAWIIGAEFLLQASPLWGRLAFLALVPATLAVYVLEKRLARPHGAVAYAAKDGRERALVGSLKAWTVLYALMGEQYALFLLYQTVQGLDLGEVSVTWMVLAAFVFPAVASTPAVTPFLTGWRFEGGLVPFTGLLLASPASFLPHAPPAVELLHLGLLGTGCLLALGGSFGIWLHRAQLRHLDRRMAHLRGRLR